MKIAVIAVFCLLLCTLTACTERPGEREIYGYFDTVTTVVGYGSEKDFEEACRLIEEELQFWHRETDIYYEYSGVNNACTLNRLAGTEGVKISRELMDVLLFGREMYDLTGGKCNIAMGAVLSLWHDARDQALLGPDSKLPEEAALREAALHCGMSDLLLSEEELTVRFADPELKLDLGALAKGYAAERIAEKLSDRGYTGYALSLGGNVRVLGTKPEGDPWVSGILDPVNTSEKQGKEALLKVNLVDQALVTSGSYQRFFYYEGVRYHHIIDPDTLYPKQDYLSVSIRAKDSALADALSTALFNMTQEEGKRLIDGLPDTEACWINAEGKVSKTAGFDE